MSRSRRTVVINEPENESKLDLTNNVEDPSINNQHDDQYKSVDVPPKQLFNYNLKQLKSFKKIRQSYKLKNLKYTFLSDMKIVLNEYLPSDSENQYNSELLIEVLNIAEEYFINKDATERETYKKDCVIELLLPYFNNDKQLLLKTIQLVEHKIKKVGLFKRLYLRTRLFFWAPTNTKVN